MKAAVPAPKGEEKNTHEGAGAGDVRTNAKAKLGRKTMAIASGQNDGKALLVNIDQATREQLALAVGFVVPGRALQVEEPEVDRDSLVVCLAVGAFVDGQVASRMHSARTGFRTRLRTFIKLHGRTLALLLVMLMLTSTSCMLYYDGHPTPLRDYFYRIKANPFVLLGVSVVISCSCLFCFLGNAIFTLLELN